MSALAERPSYEEAYAEHRVPLLRFTQRLATRYGLPDPNRDAEDIVQAAFEEALPQWPTIEQPARWLYTVARRKLVRTANRAARLGALTDGNDLDRTETRGWTSVALRAAPEDSVLARQVMDAIAGLPDRRRTVTYLRHVQGWTVQEVADLLDCAPGTVWAHTNHGVAAIRAVILGDSYDHLDYHDAHSTRSTANDISRRYWLYRSPLPLLLFMLGTAVVAYAIFRAVRAGWSVTWPAVGLGVVVLALLIVVDAVVRAGRRWWRRRS